jgi:protein TonB
MDAEDITSKQGAQESSGSTDEDILQALVQDRAPGPNGDGELANPEVERLAESLAAALERGLPEEFPGLTATSMLTLEELASVAEPAVAQPDVAKVANYSAVRCSQCGCSSPRSFRFCGNCGQQLERRVASAVLAPAPGDRIRQPEMALDRLQSESSKSPAEPAASPRSPVMSLLLLALLTVLLAVIVGQQWFIWQQPWPSRTPMSAALSAHAPVATARANSPQPRKSKGEPQAATEQPKSARGPGPSAAPVRNPSSAAPKTLKKPVIQKSVPPAGGRVPDATRRSQEEPVPPVAIEAAGGPRLPVEAPAAIPKLVEPAAKNASGPQGGAEPARIQISQGVAQGALIYKVDPDYPSIARNVRIQGPVVLRGVIAKDGTVKELRVLKGNAFLVGPAIQAVQKWRYRPYMLDGKPVEVETTITLNFKGE